MYMLIRPWLFADEQWCGGIHHQKEVNSANRHLEQEFSERFALLSLLQGHVTVAFLLLSTVGDWSFDYFTTL
jgi:hypothetical protein